VEHRPRLYSGQLSGNLAAAASNASPKAQGAGPLFCLKDNEESKSLRKMIPENDSPGEEQSGVVPTGIFRNRVKVTGTTNETIAECRSPAINSFIFNLNRFKSFFFIFFFKSLNQL